MQTVINDIPISYDLCPATGSHQCLLFLHGLQSRKEIFCELRTRLQKSFPIAQLAVDFVGFGESSKPESFDYDLTKHERIISGLLNSLNITTVHVIGHSLGGMIGTLMLETAPGVVQTLVNLEGNLCLEDCGESRRVSELPFDSFTKSYYPAMKEKLANPKESSATFRYESLLRVPDYASYRTSQAIVAWSKSGHLLDVFSWSPRPKLLVCGKNSAFKSRLNVDHSSLVEVPDSGHFMISDNPTATAVAISNFLEPLFPTL
jgi:pimeloyl-ACP methyl ester carboxylesterase